MVVDKHNFFLNICLLLKPALLSSDQQSEASMFSLIAVASKPTLPIPPWMMPFLSVR